MEAASNIPSIPSSSQSGFLAERPDQASQQLFNHSIVGFGDLSREIRDFVYEYYLDNACQDFGTFDPFRHPIKPERIYTSGTVVNWNLDPTFSFPCLTRHVKGLMMASKSTRVELMERILRRPIMWRGSLTSGRWHSFKKNILPQLHEFRIAALAGVTVTHPWQDLDNEIRQFLRWLDRRLSRPNRHTGWKLKKLKLIGIKNQAP